MTQNTKYQQRTILNTCIDAITLEPSYLIINASVGMIASETTGIRRRRNASHAKKRKDLLSNNRKTNDTTSNSTTAAQEAKDITASLRRTKSMMKQELNRISSVSETIHNDGSMLEKTKSEHFGMKGGIKGAKGSMARLKLKEKEDAIVFWASVIFFYMVAFYVLWSRIRIPFLLW